MNWAISMLSTVIVASCSLVIVRLVCCAGCPVISHTEIPYTWQVPKFALSASTSSRLAYSRCAPSKSALTMLVSYKRASLRSALIILQPDKSESWIRAPTSVASERSAPVNRECETITADNSALTIFTLLKSQESRIPSPKWNPDRLAPWRFAPVKCGLLPMSPFTRSGTTFGAALRQSFQRSTPDFRTSRWVWFAISKCFAESTVPNQRLSRRVFAIFATLGPLLAKLFFQFLPMPLNQIHKQRRHGRPAAELFRPLEGAAIQEFPNV